MIMEFRANFIQINRTKLENYHQRALAAIAQIGDQDLNWRPNEESNSIANIVLHMQGNLAQRFLTNLKGETDVRNRDREFNAREILTKDEIIHTLDHGFTIADTALAELRPEQLDDIVVIMGKDNHVYEMIFNTVTHFCEHVGQIIYIAKLRSGSDFSALSTQHRKI